MTPVDRGRPQSPVPAPSFAPPAPSIVIHVQRDRTRAFLRAAFPRRKGRVVAVKSATDCERALRTTVVDAVIVDLAAAQEETWRIAALAREYPSAPFFGITSLRAGEASVLAHCASHEFVDVLVDAVDERVARQLVVRECFTSRFARALDEPPAALSLVTPLQRSAWRYVVANAGRSVQTALLAKELRVTREHLSRSFAAGGAPNLKRVIDLVRLLVAAELAKNPGHDLRDIAHMLAYASASHLAATSQRIAGTRPVSLSRLRTVDLIDRFAKGHARSRG
jgi:AraC-like DNA-binding protein